MDVADFEYILTQISDLISPKHRLGGTGPIKCDERLAIILRYLATGESFNSRISLNTVLYVVKGCCKAIVERIALAFIKVLPTKAEWLDMSRKFEGRWNFSHAQGAIDGKH